MLFTQLLHLDMYAVVLVSLCLLPIIGAYPIASEEDGFTIFCEEVNSTSEIICKQFNGTTSKEEIINITMPLCDILLDLRGNFTNCRITVNEESENSTQIIVDEGSSGGLEFSFDEDPTTEDQGEGKIEESGENISTEQNLQEVLNNDENYITSTLNSLTLSKELSVDNKIKDKPIYEKVAIGDTIDDEDYYDTTEESGVNDSEYSDENDTNYFKEEEMGVSATEKANTTESDDRGSFDGKENDVDLGKNQESINSTSVEGNLSRKENSGNKNNIIEDNLNTNNEEFNTAKSEGIEEAKGDNSNSSKVEETISQDVNTTQDMDESSIPTSAPEPNRKETDAFSFWNWLFRSIMPKETERVKRDENSYIPSGTSDVNDSKESMQHTDTNTDTKITEGSELQPLTQVESSEPGLTNDFQGNSSEENNFMEDVNKTKTECIGDECDTNLDKIETEIAKLENELFASGQGETTTTAFWNTDKYDESNPWMETKINGEEMVTEGMKQLMANDINDNHLELEIFVIKSYELDSNNTLSEIELINILPIKTHNNSTESQYDMLLPGNISQPETTIINLHFQYEPVNLPINKTVLLRLALNKLSEMEMEDHENGDEINFGSINERETNTTSDNTEMKNDEEESGNENSDTF